MRERLIRDTDTEIIELSTEDKVRLCQMIPKHFCRNCSVSALPMETYQKLTKGKFFCRSWCEISWSSAMEKVVTEKLLGVDALISKISGQYLEEKCQ